jgi:hypothetical protein
MTNLEGRDTIEIEALVTDRYLDSLLAAHARGADHAPAATLPPTPIRSVADRLARDLPRYHPSFRFEEALAGRLAAVAESMRVQRGAGPRVVAFPGGPLGSDIRSTRGRPLLVGGAVTSAALSLAGAGYLVWRRVRPSAGTRAI